MSKSRVTKPATIPPWADDYAGCPKCKRLKSETPRTELTRLLTAAKQAEPILQHVRRQFDSALSCDSRSDDSTRAARIVLIELLNAIKQCDVAAMPNIKAEPPPVSGGEAQGKHERDISAARIIGLEQAAEIAAQQAADDARAADSTTDLDSRLNYLAQQERALAIKKAIRSAAMPNQKMIEWEIELASPEAFVTISAPEDAKDDQLLALACDELTRKTYIWSKKRTNPPNKPS